MKRCKIGDICLHTGVINAGKIFVILKEFDGDYWRVQCLSGGAINSAGKFSERGICRDALLMPINGNPDQYVQNTTEIPVRAAA